MFICNLKKGDTITNNDLMDIFKCANVGGMRYSTKTQTLVLVTDHTKGFYHDIWVSPDRIDYTGMGKTGDMDIDYAQNKKLHNYSGEILVYLFEVFKPNEYTFRGEVVPANNKLPYQIVQKDFKGVDRLVWMFPLKIK